MKKGLRDSYKKYCSTTESPVDIKTYLLIAAEYNKFLIEKVLLGYEVTLPARLGTLSIIGRKQQITVENGKIKGLAPDWVKTKKLWERNEKAKQEKKILYHTNNHTDNVRYKFFWSKNKVLVTNKSLYSLRMTRNNKRAVHKILINNLKRYKTLL